MFPAGHVSRRDRLVDGYLVQSRFAEAVARKPHVVTAGCPMCAKVVDPAGSPIVLARNDYPFADGHLLAIAPRHTPRFDSKEWEVALRMASERGLAIAYQELDSGATLPQHAHLSMFNDFLPILQELPRPRRAGPSAHYPGFAVEAPFGPRYDGTFHLLRDWYSNHRIPINVVGEPGWGWMVIPRRSLRSVSGRRLGSVEVAGIFIANLERYHPAAGTKVDHLLREYESLDLQPAIGMIRDVTFPPDDPSAAAVSDLISSAGIAV